MDVAIWQANVPVDGVAAYRAAARGSRTWRAYQSDWRCWSRWCERNGVDPLNADPDAFCRYLVDLAARYSPGTVERRLAGISAAYATRGLDGPRQYRVVRETLRGIRRAWVDRCEQSGRPVVRRMAAADLPVVARMVNALPANLRGLRDRALLLVGFAGALRRSELAALRVEDVEDRGHALVLHIRRSKTDQLGEGADVPVYAGVGDLCPVRALREWLQAAGIQSGPVFRAVDRNTGRVLDGPLCTETVRLAVKRAAEAAGLDPDDFGAHSLRAGFVTQAAVNGAPLNEIMGVSRHRSERVARAYIRKSEALQNVAARTLWQAAPAALQDLAASAAV